MSSNTSLEVLGARKRKLSTKASTNGDPLEAKRKKTLSEAKKGGAAALTKKTSFVTKNSKATGKKASENGSGNSTLATGSDTPVTGMAVQKIVDTDPEATEGVDNDIISVDDDDHDDKQDDESSLESAEESAEAELGRFFFFLSISK